MLMAPMATRYRLLLEGMTQVQQQKSSHEPRRMPEALMASPSIRRLIQCKPRFNPVHVKDFSPCHQARRLYDSSMPIGPPNSWLKCFRALLSLWLLSGGLDAEESRASDASEEASDAASAFWSVKPVVEIKRPNVKAWLASAADGFSCAAPGSSWSDPSTAGRCAHLGAPAPLRPHRASSEFPGAGSLRS